MIALPVGIVVAMTLAVAAMFVAQQMWMRRELARHHVRMRAMLTAQHLALREVLRPAAGLRDYPAGHDAEQAMGPLLTPPPRAGDPVYGTGAGGAAHGAADRAGGDASGRHRRGAQFAPSRAGARPGPDRPGQADEDAGDPSGQADDRTEGEPA